MGAQGFDNVPHRLESRVVENGLGVVPGTDEHRDHNGADVLAWCLAYGPANRLYDVDLRATGFDEGDTVQGGYVDAL